LANCHVSYHRIGQFRPIGQFAAQLANSTIFLKPTILVIIVFGVLTGSNYSSTSLSVSPKADLTSPSPPCRRHFAVATG
jgi:hypothetical protein